MNKPIRVAIIFGARSFEHEISIWSASSILNQINRNQYHPIPIYIDEKGNWCFHSDQMQCLIEKNPNLSWIKDYCLNEDNVSINSKMNLLFDVAFPVLHGPNGEDGMIQAILESWQVPYVGCGMLSSALAMDKLIAKSLFELHQLPVIPYAELRKYDWEHNKDEQLMRLETKLQYPMFVKPANMGSSIGISKAKHQESLKEAIELAFQYDNKLIIEHGLNECRELELSVLGNDVPKVSVIGEIKPANEFYDYASKYKGLPSKLIIPAPLDDSMRSQIHEIGKHAYHILNCRGFARIDFLLDEQTQNVYLNEINTIPGFTNISMYPMLWEASGIMYPDLISQLIELALEDKR